MFIQVQKITPVTDNNSILSIGSPSRPLITRILTFEIRSIILNHRLAPCFSMTAKIENNGVEINETKNQGASIRA
jgi:hypothetical protein